MGLSESTQVGSQVQLRQDRLNHGLRTQDGDSTRSSHTFSADDDQQFGHVQCWRIKCKAAADQAYDAAAAITNVFGSTKLARNEKYRIIAVRTTLRELRTGGTPDHDLKVQIGDGAASETFADLVATVDFDGDTVNLPTERILVNAETILLSGETIRVQLQVSGTTTTGSTEVDVDILAIPCKA